MEIREYTNNAHEVRMKNKRVAVIKTDSDDAMVQLKILSKQSLQNYHFMSCGKTRGIAIGNLSLKRDTAFGLFLALLNAYDGFTKEMEEL